MKCGLGQSYVFKYKYGGSFMFNCNCRANDIWAIKNEFIWNICSAWVNYNFKEPNYNFGTQILWNNAFIKNVNGGTTFGKSYTK